MKESFSELQQNIHELSERYSISLEAVIAMAQAVVNGKGSMAQFNIPELGGMGQWMRGGMTMVSDRSNYSLQTKVTSLCAELTLLLSSSPSFGKSVMQGQGVGQQAATSK